MTDHVLKIELGWPTLYTLTCNLGDDARCHQVPAVGEGSDGEWVGYGECVIAEWVNDGGIENVGFEHIIEFPVSYHWANEGEYPVLEVGA